MDQLDLLILHQPLPTRFDLTLEAYRALETLLADGRVRAIGVSNLMPDHLQRLLAAASVVPAVNQIDAPGEGGSTFDEPVIADTAKAHGKTPAQVMLRWHLHEGRSAIPRSTRPARIAENFDVYDFDLTQTELAAIDALGRGVRRGPDPASITLETYGCEIPEA